MLLPIEHGSLVPTAARDPAQKSHAAREACGRRMLPSPVLPRRGGFRPMLKFDTRCCESASLSAATFPPPPSRSGPAPASRSGPLGARRIGSTPRLWPCARRSFQPCGTWSRRMAVAHTFKHSCDELFRRIDAIDCHDVEVAKRARTSGLSRLPENHDPPLVMGRCLARQAVKIQNAAGPRTAPIGARSAGSRRDAAYAASGGVRSTSSNASWRTWLWRISSRSSSSVTTPLARHSRSRPKKKRSWLLSGCAL
jgi:hypothetical protein